MAGFALVDELIKNFEWKLLDPQEESADPEAVNDEAGSHKGVVRGAFSKGSIQQGASLEECLSLTFLFLIISSAKTKEPSEERVTGLKASLSDLPLLKPLCDYH